MTSQEVGGTGVWSEWKADPFGCAQDDTSVGMGGSSFARMGHPAFMVLDKNADPSALLRMTRYWGGDDAGVLDGQERRSFGCAPCGRFALDDTFVGFG
jgi:hypothetical protein